MERKDYNCPECENKMRYLQKLDEFVCDICMSYHTNKSLEIIEKLKQQIHQMRNCENCANYKKGKSIFAQFYCQLDTEDECIENDKKHWTFGKE